MGLRLSGRDTTCENPPKRVNGLASRLGHAALVLCLASPLSAGGLDAAHVDSDPCPLGVTYDLSGMTGDVLRQFHAIRAMTCPDEVRVFIDRATGLPLTDDAILARVFDGSRIPTQIPLPASALLLLAGLGALTIIRRKS